MCVGGEVECVHVCVCGREVEGSYSHYVSWVYIFKTTAGLREWLLKFANGIVGGLENDSLAMKGFFQSSYLWSCPPSGRLFSSLALSGTPPFPSPPLPPLPPPHSCSVCEPKRDGWGEGKVRNTATTYKLLQVLTVTLPW